MGTAMGLGGIYLAVCAHSSDDCYAQCLGPLGGNEANAPGRGMEKNGFTWLHLVCGTQEVTHGHAFQHHAGSGFVADCSGDFNQMCGWHIACGRIGSNWPIAIGYAVSNFQLCYPLPYGFNNASSLRTQSRGQG